MGIFYLDRDGFDVQLNLLISARNNFDNAKNESYDGVRESSEIWSEFSRLDQLGLPLRDMVANIDDRLGQISSRYEGVVPNLRQAVQNFEGIDKDERTAYMTKSNGLVGRFAYNSTNTPERQGFDLTSRSLAEDIAFGLKVECPAEDGGRPCRLCRFWYRRTDDHFDRL